VQNNRLYRRTRSHDRDYVSDLSLPALAKHVLPTVLLSPRHNLGMDSRFRISNVGPIHQSQLGNSRAPRFGSGRARLGPPSRPSREGDRCSDFSER
jgi:hypothetical protein